MDVGWNFRREHLPHPAALALRHHQWRRSAERRAAERRGLVLLPRNRLPAHQGDVGDRRPDGEGGVDDDRHRGVDRSVLGSAWPGHFNKTIAETMHANIESVGLPQWTEADQTLAKALQHELKVPEVGTGDEAQRAARPRAIPDEEKRGGGSDDIGDISWNVPTVTLRYPSNIAGGSGPQLGERDLDGDADRAQGRHTPARRCRR